MTFRRLAVDTPCGTDNWAPVSCSDIRAHIDRCSLNTRQRPPSQSLSQWKRHHCHHRRSRRHHYHRHYHRPSIYLHCHLSIAELI